MSAYVVETKKHVVLCEVSQVETFRAFFNSIFIIELNRVRDNDLSYNVKLIGFEVFEFSYLETLGWKWDIIMLE